MIELMQIDFNSLVNDFARGQALAIRLSQAGGSVRDLVVGIDIAVAESTAAVFVVNRPATCECDYDCEGDPLQYVKTSHYCPIHDECESCGECLGVMKDPDFPKGYDLKIVKRASWLCQKCSELCADCGNHPPTEGHTQACIDRTEESAIEAALCTFCGADECRKHTNAELLARGGGNL